VDWWELARTRFHEILVELASKGPTACIGLAPVAEMVVFTDSSLTGWAVVLLWGSKIEIAAGPWERHEHINILETRTVLKALQMLPPQDKWHKCQLFLDNTTAQGVVQRGSSPNYVLNHVAGQIRHVAELKMYFLRMTYINTLYNVADPFSRVEWAGQGTQDGFNTTLSFEEIHSGFDTGVPFDQRFNSSEGFYCVL
jgi:hypothetical protein